MDVFDRLKVKNRADFLSGLLFLALGGLALLESLRYEMGDLQRMGAGFFPVVLSAILILLGVAVALTSLWRREARELSPEDDGAEGPEDRARAIRQGARALFFVTLALVLFALGLPRIGLVLAVIGLVVVSSFADPTLSWRATFVIALLMAFVAVAVFRWGIGLPFPIWPR